MGKSGREQKRTEERQSRLFGIVQLFVRNGNVNVAGPFLILLGNVDWSQIIDLDF